MTPPTCRAAPPESGQGVDGGAWCCRFQLPYAVDCLRVALSDTWLAYAVDAALAGRPVRTHAISVPTRTGATREIVTRAGELLVAGQAFAGEAEGTGHGCADPVVGVVPDHDLDLEVVVEEVDERGRPWIPRPLGLEPAR